MKLCVVANFGEWSLPYSMSVANNWEFEYLTEFEFILGKDLGFESGDQVNSFNEKIAKNLVQVYL